MKIQYDPDFIKSLKKVNVRIRKNFEEKIRIFLTNPYDLSLNNHFLRESFQGFRSIDVTADYRTVYEEIIEEEEETVAYFTLIGTHKELYKSFSKN